MRWEDWYVYAIVLGPVLAGAVWLWVTREKE